MPEFSQELESDLAELSLLSYEPNGGVPSNDRWELLHGGIFRPEAITGVFEFPYDYQIVVYRSRVDHTLVLAHRGTVLTSLSNWVRDDGLDIFFNQFTQRVPHYLRFSRIVRDQLRQQYPGYELIHTGHSLGGANATLHASIEGEMAIYFDSPGVQQILDRVDELRQAYASRLAITQGHVKKIYGVIAARNLVNAFGTHLAVAQIRRINVEGHAISGISEYLQRNLISNSQPRFNTILNIQQVNDFLNQGEMRSVSTPQSSNHNFHHSSLREIFPTQSRGMSFFGNTMLNFVGQFTEESIRELHISNDVTLPSPTNPTPAPRRTPLPPHTVPPSPGPSIRPPFLG